MITIGGKHSGLIPTKLPKPTSSSSSRTGLILKRPSRIYVVILKSPVVSPRDSVMFLSDIFLPLRRFAIGELSLEVGAKLLDRITSLEVKELGTWGASMLRKG
jgi:hypothetical protein